MSKEGFMNTRRHEAEGVRCDVTISPPGSRRGQSARDPSWPRKGRGSGGRMWRFYTKVFCVWVAGQSRNVITAARLHEAAGGAGVRRRRRGNFSTGSLRKQRRRDIFSRSWQNIELRALTDVYIVVTREINVFVFSTEDWWPLAVISIRWGRGVLPRPERPGGGAQLTRGRHTLIKAENLFLFLITVRQQMIYARWCSVQNLKFSKSFILFAWLRHRSGGGAASHGQAGGCCRPPPRRCVHKAEARQCVTRIRIAYKQWTLITFEV